jgi:hypothetical protein
VPEEPVHAALDERVARTGQRHVAEPAVGTRPLPAHQALAFGPGDALRDGPGADQAQLGDGSRGEPVRRWTADIARDLGPRGITANVVSPGLTLGSEFFRDTLTEARKQRLIAETDNGRPGTTADVAALVTFLASPSAGHVTGQVIHVNGGAYLGR